MSKVAVVYWSSTGNTEAMANAVAEGAKENGADVSLFEAADFSADKVDEFDGLAFGCPAMGAEQLDEDEFEPIFNSCVPKLTDKKLAIFGSYDWGDGEWLRTWADDCKNAGLDFAADPLKCHLTPEDEDIDNCKALGSALA